MNYLTYKMLVKSIRIGKHLPDAIYLHKASLKLIPSKLKDLIITTINTMELQNVPWNIVKLRKNKFSYSLLCYPDFFSDPYPALTESYTIDLQNFTYRKTSYIKSANPPILHRKETFLPPNHDAIVSFKKITKEAEKAGLYANTTKIGFRKNWENLLKEKGYSLINGELAQLLQEKTQPKVIVERHKTAIDRYSLSTPMQTLYRHNYLQGDYSVFDYGCGKGDDLNILSSQDIKASGWDPVYYPNYKESKADIVNLGFVINVIENPTERLKTIRNAYKLTEKILVVSVMLGGNAIIEKYEKYGDGIITSRKTFQKYYSQTEIKGLLQECLGETAIAVGPGIFYVFKDKIEEQNFLVARQRLKHNWRKLSYTDHPERLKVKQRALYERHKQLFEEFWQLCLELGRLPTSSEFTKSEDIRLLCASHQKAFNLLKNIYTEKPFIQSAETRRNDLLVYYALGLFGKRKPYKNMPAQLKRDTKHFFGNYSLAIKEATELLFSVGKPEIINKYCVEAYKQIGRGKLEDNHSLTIHRNDIELLPAELRVYLGCATQLYGDMENIDLVKIHIRSGKVSLMRYDDFKDKPLPLLLERIKIKLRNQEIDFFEYGSPYPPPPLFLKSILIPENFPNFQKQRSFDKKLQTFSWLNLTGYGIPLSDFEHRLSQANALIKGFKILRKNK